MHLRAVDSEMFMSCYPSFLLYLCCSASLKNLRSGVSVSAQRATRYAAGAPSTGVFGGTERNAAPRAKRRYAGIVEYQSRPSIITPRLWRPWRRPSVGRRRHAGVAGRRPSAWRHHVRRHRWHRRHPRMRRHPWRHWRVAHARRWGAGWLRHPLPRCRSRRRLRHALVGHILPRRWYVDVRHGLLVVGPVLNKVHDVLAP